MTDMAEAPSAPAGGLDPLLACAPGEFAALCCTRPVIMPP